MADWQYNAKKDLMEYPHIKESLVSIPEELKALEIDMQLVRGTSYDKSPVQGGASGREDRLIDYIDKKGRLAENLRAATVRVRRIERGLEGLTDNERLVLHRFFISREHGHVERLCQELGYEERTIYRIKDSALKRFTLSMFGVIDL